MAINLKAVRLSGATIALVLGTVAAIPAATAQSEMPLRVLLSGGFNAAYQVLQPTYQQSSGVVIETVLGQSVAGAPTAIPDRLANGEPADLVVMARGPLDKLVAEGQLLAGSEVDLAASSIAMAVADDAAVPDISTPEAFEAFLANVDSIGVSTSASGVYLKGTLFPSLDGAAALLTKTRSIGDKLVGEALRSGEVAVGFQQLSELMAIDGISVVGPLPETMQRVTMFSAAVVSNSAARDEAQAFIDYLAAPENFDAIEASGLVPPATR